MQHLFDAWRAALLVTLALAGWSFLGVASGSDGGTDLAGALYLLSAFGLLGLPAFFWASATGAVAGSWSRFLGGRRSEELDGAIVNWLSTALVGLVAIAGAIAVVHLFVTASFVQPIFQAAGIALALVASGIVVIGVSPSIHGLLSRITRRIGLRPSSELRASRRFAFFIAFVAVAGVAGGLFAASRLNVFSARTLGMIGAIIVAIPAFQAAMTRWPIERIAWRIGAPVAGLIAAIATFAGAASWTSSSPEMMEASTQRSALVALELRALQRLGDGDGDGFASVWGGRDCDDTSERIYPGAPEIAGNGIDESCSGEDAEPPKYEDHPSRKIVKRAVTLAGSAAQQEAEKIPDPPKNVLLLLVDTLRMDHLGFGGYERPTSPNMDALASDGVVFERAYATSPHTPRSIPAIFISRYASKTKWRGGQYNYPKVRPENVSVFEVMDEAGWRNLGVTSHFYFEEKKGLWQGFDNWDNEGAGSISDANDDIAAPRIWERLEPLIEELGREQESPDAAPFGLFVHLFEPHARWIPHDEYPFEHDGTTESRHKASYDSEIAFVDNYVGKILDKLETTGLADDTIIVLVSDHGEAFNEHGFFFHGQTLYNEIIHVPLVVKVPGWNARRVAEPVSIIDIAPTLTDLLDLSTPADFQGESLVPSMLGREPDGMRPIFSELLPYTSWKEHHKAVILGDQKLISVLSSGTRELYDLESDPGEQTNRIESAEDDAKALQDELNRFMQE